jgi:hypothetical protein
MCPTGVLKAVDLKDLDLPSKPEYPELPGEIEVPDLSGIHFPSRISLAVRGVGGQGNLFFGHVLTQLAFLAGYGEQNIIKGETHGMAQMGGSHQRQLWTGDDLVLLPVRGLSHRYGKSEVLPNYQMLKPAVPFLANTIIISDVPMKHTERCRSNTPVLSGHRGLARKPSSSATS